MPTCAAFQRAFYWPCYVLTMVPAFSWWRVTSYRLQNRSSLMRRSSICVPAMVTLAPCDTETPAQMRRFIG